MSIHFCVIPSSVTTSFRKLLILSKNPGLTKVGISCYTANMSRNIVTRDSLAVMLRNPNRAYVEAVIGRALVALLSRQTETERESNDTCVHNYIGFSGADAKSGSLTAKSWLKRRHLEDWQIEKWTRPARNGYPRLCKYAVQLNDIAMRKAS